jgi:hypothetical protein
MRGGNLQLALATLHELWESMSRAPLEVYERFEADAR